MAADKNSGVTGKNAFELFPDIVKNVAPKKKAKKAPAQPKGSPDTPENPLHKILEPPKPPDISRLVSGENDSVTHDADTSTVLLLMAEGEEKARVTKKFEDLGYFVETAASEEEAIEKMSFATPDAVILHVGFAAQQLSGSKFHQHMKTLPMTKRRYIYYILIGPQFQTLYNLQALAESANLVINEQHLDKLDMILRKGLQEYDNLFGLYIEFLQLHGRK